MNIILSKKFNIKKSLYPHPSLLIRDWRALKHDFALIIELLSFLSMPKTVAKHI